MLGVNPNLTLTLDPEVTPGDTGMRRANPILCGEFESAENRTQA